MIQVDKIVKKFGHFKAVDEISFNVREGEILGFLGPNGAGKSTTMRMITGYIQPTSGSVKVNNIDISVNPEAVKSLIGYLPETTPVYKDMTVYTFLSFAASVRNVKNIKDSIDRVIELCHLNRVYRKPIDTLSKGYTQRVCLAQALIHDPRCLILDEPTDGLDPIQKKEIQELIKRMGLTKTILISTHMLDEVEDYCNRVIIISEGKIRAEGNVDEIKKLSNESDSLLLEVPLIYSEKIEKFISENLENKLSKIIKNSTGSGVSFRMFPENCEKKLQIVKETFHFIENNNIQFTDFKFDKGSLTDAFRNVAVSSKIKKTK